MMKQKEKEKAVVWRADEIDNNNFSLEKEFKCSVTEFSALTQTSESIKKTAHNILNEYLMLEAKRVETDKDRLKEYKFFETKSRDA